MSVEIVHKTARNATTAAVEACWIQWRALGFPASATPDREPTSIIDPEALVLLSTQVALHERRLEDALAWWARSGATLLSVQRTSSLLRAFPPSTRGAFGPFAHEARDAGDRRWKRYVGDHGLASGRRPKGSDEPNLSNPASLMLRLRAGFGVGVKTDLLTYLLGRFPREATIKDAQASLFYTAPALRTAAAEMSLAALIQPIAGRPVRYIVDASPWSLLLRDGTATTGPDRSPGPLRTWRDWPHLFAFLVHVTALAEKADDEGTSPYVLSSRARDLVLPRLPLFAMNQIDVPDPKAYKGEAYLEGLNMTVRNVTDWLAAHL